MKPRPHVLLIEDDVPLGDALSTLLASEGYRVTCSRRGDEGCRMALSLGPDLVVTDLRMPGMGGMDLVQALRDAQPTLPIILITAHGTPSHVIESTKHGAFDYLSKPFEMDEFLASVRRSLEHRPETALAEADTDPMPGLVGKSRAMQAIYKEIGRLAPRPINVLIRGETGTGKELVARALHEHSQRAGKPFVAVNCAALSESLLESELFGHERGAFTGAVERRMGRFEQAADGTLFLDEIGELAPSTQAKLLRVLQEGTFERVGGRQVLRSMARIIAATHVDIQAAMATKAFREDLYYRLNQATLFLPPLRDRPEDVAEIANHLIRLHSPRVGAPPIALADDLIHVLQTHDWPGNVRELENVVRQLLIKSDGRDPSIADARKLIETGAPPSAEAPGLTAWTRSVMDAAEKGSLRDCHAHVIEKVERALLSEAMERAHGNQSQVARWLGISRLTLREKLRELGLHPADS